MSRRPRTLGILVALALPMAVASAGCSKGASTGASPTAPSSQDSSSALTGTARVWRGVAGLTCTGSGTVCVGPALDFALRLVGDGARASGTIQFRSFFWNGAQAIDVEGAASPGGDLVMTGTQRIPIGASDMSVAIDLRLKLKIDRNVDGAVSLTFTKDGVSGTSSGSIVFAREVTTVAPGPFEGQWQGTAVRTACTGTCDDFLAETISLLMSQSGSIVRTTYGSGTASGRSLTLDTSRPPYSPCGPSSYDDVYCRDVRHYDLTVDELERLKGTYTVDVDMFPEDSARRTYRATYQLVGVSRWP